MNLKNGLMAAAVIALALTPLLTVNRGSSVPDTLFKGSDAQAVAVIQTVAPGYVPWFRSIFPPPSSEIESLLFALQAAIGAGFIGYYIGYSRGRRRQNNTPSDNDHAH